MAYFINAPPRVGRSQGASIFWGLISACFAAAACYYFWKSTENERSADVMRDQLLQLREENDTLQSQKTHLQASMGDAESQIKTREDLVQEKETQLATEELRIEGEGRQATSQAAPGQAQAAMMKKFEDLIRKLGKGAPSDVVERGGRPVLRVPDAQLFAVGDAALTPDGKVLLTQVSQSLGGQIDAFELRVACYTDTDAEQTPAAGAKKDSGDPATHAASWTLTANRAAAVSRFFRDQTPLPFANVLVAARGDTEPLAPNGGDNHARNRRVEITVTPLPAPFHSPDADKGAGANPAATSAPSKPGDNPAPAKKSNRALPVDKTAPPAPAH